MKLSPAFATLLHIIWGGALGLIIAGATAVYQYNTKNGINFGQDAILFALTVVTGLGSTALATLHNIQASPALPVAESEVASTLAQQAHQRIDAIITWLENHSQEHALQSAQKPAVPSSLRPTTLQPIPADNTPVVPPVPNTPPMGAVTTSTVPGMPVVQVPN